MERRSRRRDGWSMAALVLAVVLAGCGGDSLRAGGSADGDASAAAAQLHGDWTLRSGTGPGGEVDLGDGTVEVTLTIDAERWGGTVCNSYGSTEVEVGDGTVALGDVFRTEMACLDPGVMEAEDAYLAAFAEVGTWALTDEQLTLAGDGEVELVYDRATATAEGAARPADADGRGPPAV